MFQESGYSFILSAWWRIRSGDIPPLHLATSAKGAVHLNEAVVVEAELAEKAANQVLYPVTAFRHCPNS